MELEKYKREGVNYDFIVALEKYEQRVRLVKIPISRRNELIITLIHMVDSEMFDVTDMVHKMKMTFGQSPEIIKCFGYDGNFPDYDCKKYYEENLKTDKRIKNQEDKGYYESANMIRNATKERRRNDKIDYLKKALSYISASDYNETFRKHKVEDSYILHSSLLCGWYSTSYIIDSDTSVSINSVCYVNENRIRLKIKYKGLKVLPYSVWVRCYYVRLSAILGQCPCYEWKYDGWYEFMSFLEDFINSAIADPQNFIYNVIITEVKTLVNGLENIFFLDKDKFENNILNNTNCNDIRYIGIESARQANKNDIETYENVPNETILIYRIEKICGALYFIDSLNELRSIYPEITDLISKIIELNQAISPEIDQAISLIENNSEVKSIEKELKRKKVVEEVCEERIERCKSISKKFVDNPHQYFKTEFGHKFMATTVRFENDEDYLRNLHEQLFLLRSNNKEKTSLLKKLHEYKALIRCYTEQ